MLYLCKLEKRVRGLGNGLKREMPPDGGQEIVNS